MTVDTAAAQLRRFLALIPEIADGREHTLDELSERLGMDAAAIAKNLYAFSERYGDPPGWIEKVRVYLERDRVSVDAATHFQRPMRLSPTEMRALDLGLSLCRAEASEEKRATIDAVRDRLHALLSRQLDEHEGRSASLGMERDLTHVPALKDSMRRRQRAAIWYRKGASAEAERREVCPLTFVMEQGLWYLIAHCERSQGVRIFRVDRIEKIELLTETFEPTPGLDVDKLLADHRAFIGTPPATLRVRYSPRVARWISERESGTRRPDGSYDVEYPLADQDWAVRHVLRYGPEAEVLDPVEVRAAIVERLSRATA
jgi:proteasome accessory factor C